MSDTPLSAVHHPVLRGQQSVAGLWFPTDRFDEAERAHLLLAHWQPGANAWRFEEGDLLRWPQPQRLQCEQLLGWPLVLKGRTLCSAPLQEHECTHLPTADLWLVRNSQVEALDLKDATSLQPGQWLDISTYALLDTYDCSAAVPDPVMQQDVRTDVREILGNAVGAPPGERDEVIKALQASPGHSKKTSAQINKGGLRTLLKIALGLVIAVAVFSLLPESSEKPAKLQDVPHVVQAVHSAPSSGTDFLTTFIVLAVLGYLVGRWLMPSGSSERSRQIRPDKSSAAVPKKTSPGIQPRRQKSRFTPHRLDRWLTRLTNASRLDSLFAKRQANYLKRMLDMFEDGNLQEALRHAIPLSNDSDENTKAFGTPQRRADLELSQQERSGKAIHFPEDFRDLLRKTYRASFEKLDRESRIDEAVFVLAELLKARQEALDYLERHKRYKQGADLALAWDMSPATIVRQLCLAEDWERAIQVARRDDAFDEAVTSMESKWPEQAKRLRLEWAEALAAKGNWLKAVDVIWSLTEERSRAAQWLLSAEAGGERLAAEALVKRALLLPDTLLAYETYLTELRDDPERKTERQAIARALLANRNQSKACSWLATLFAGHWVADQQLNTTDLQKLIKLSNDPLLQADLPKLNFAPAPPLQLRTTGNFWHWQAPTMGTRRIVDAVSLDDRRSLVALGESGVLILDAHGRRLCHFAIPTQHLVLAESRQMALAVIRRGELWRVSKLDLVNRTVLDLGILAMDNFASQFDGIGWAIGKGNHVRVVDVSPGFATLWHVDNLPGKVLGVFADATTEHLLLQEPAGNLQRWRYRLPERRLLARDELALKGREGSTIAFGLAGEPIEYWLNDPEADKPVVMIEHSGRCAGYSLPDLDREAIDWPQIYLGSQWMVVVYWTENGNQQLRFFSRADDRSYACIDWPGRDHISVNCIAGQWTAFDAQGRLFCLNVEDVQPRRLSI